MKKVPQKAIHLLVVSLLVLLGSSARAGEGSVLADDNATVQVNGPRMGDNGKRFFNMEGKQNGNLEGFQADRDFGASQFRFHPRRRAPLLAYHRYDDVHPAGRGPRREV